MGNQFKIITIIGCTLSAILSSQQAIAEPICSDDVTEIVPQLLTDLPSYSNRVIQRSRKLSRQEDTYSYVLVASLADFRPIPLSTEQFTSTVPDTTQQVFFTVLEKQYLNNNAVTFENYYWLFLTPTSQGWAIANLVSSFANLKTDALVSPPQNSIQGAIGQATKLWLRDFNAHCGKN